MEGGLAGHSKFKNIMHRKGAQDKKRSSLFSKLSREITVAAKMGLPDPDANARLRAAINAAKAQSVPKDNIQRSIDKATGGDGDNYEEIRYEGYGPGGVSLIVEALTDNRNRTAGDIRTLFGKNGGTLGELNSVSYQFGRVGEIYFPLKAATGDQMFEAALEAGADDVVSDEDGHTINCAVDALGAVRDALEAKFGTPEQAKLVWKPQATIPLDEEAARTLLKFLDALDDNDDVQSVAANYEIAEDLMARLVG